jgi:hypothetical protein
VRSQRIGISVSLYRDMSVRQRRVSTEDVQHRARFLAGNSIDHRSHKGDVVALTLWFDGHCGDKGDGVRTANLSTGIFDLLAVRARPLPLTTSPHRPAIILRLALARFLAECD